MKVKTPKPVDPPKPVPLPDITDADVQKRKALALQEMRTRKGRGSTLLSGGDLSAARGSTYQPLLS